MTNNSWNLVILWIIEIGEFELIGRYSKFSTDDFSKCGIAYCSLEDSYFGKKRDFSYDVIMLNQI